MIKRDKLGRFIKGHYNGGSTGKHWEYPHPFTETHRKNLSETHKGIHSSPATEFKEGKNMGENHHNWKGGISRENHRRETKQYIQWRKATYKRDNWTCRICGKKCYTDIVAHHLKSWDDYPELRFAIDNGITLCRKHHINLHKIIKEIYRLAKSNCQ